MTFTDILPLFIAFAIGAVLCPLLIPLLKRLKFGQNVRAEGNPEHLKKQGTPTMGGLTFVAAITVTGLIFSFTNPEVLPVLIMTLGFSVIGFADDYLKVVKKQSEGFRPRQKLICQFVLTAGFIVYCYLNPEIGTEVILPFTGGRTWDMGLLFIPFVFFCVIGTDNGTNFTDGLDGLAASVSIVVALFFFIAAGMKGNGAQPIAAAAAGSLMGYVLFNSHPARLFMGDTGSLAIGGFVSGMAIVMRMGWFIIIVGLIYLVEVISVILQVGYFRCTHGKRLFKMAPIHHHFELCGMSETQIVTMFTVITVLLCLVGLLAM